MLFYDKYTVKEEDVTQLRFRIGSVWDCHCCTWRGSEEMGLIAYCSDNDTAKCALAGASQALFCSATGWFAGRFPSQHTVGKLDFTPRFVLLILHRSMPLRFSLSSLTGDDENINFTLIFRTPFCCYWTLAHKWGITVFFLSTKSEVSFLKIRFLTAMVSYGLQKGMAWFAKEDRLLR